MSATTITYPPAWTNLRAALAHDWLTGMRGGEKCLELIGNGLPDAPIYCLVHKRGSVSTAIERHPIHASLLNRIPGISRTYRYFLPAFPLIIETLGRPHADLLISTSHCAVKALRTRPATRHLCYCFTPMRYAWTFHDEYFGAAPLKRALLKPLLGGLRAWDRATAARVDRFVAISHHVRRRIELFYGREADVVYPPVDTGFYTPDPAVTREDFALVVSALVPYKRVDLAVQACTESGRRLLVVGAGTGLDRLQAVAGPSVTFLGWQSDEAIRNLYRRCRYLLFPGEEDFGIVPLEAMACGAPVIAYRRGGLTETLAENVSGLFFDAQTPDALNDAIRTAEGQSWPVNPIRKHAEQFGQQAFIDGLTGSVAAVMAC